MEGVRELQEAVKKYGTSIKSYEEFGFIRATLHPSEPYILFNYSDIAQYEGRWNVVERASRGLILNHQTGEIVALPFAKFFNLNEREETRIANLPAGEVEVTDKLDGSLGVLFRTTDGYSVATRGSFASRQGQWATRLVRTRYNLSDLDPDITLLFEIIYPDNRIVLNYGDKADLFLIGARRFDGYDLPYRELVPLAEKYGFPLVPREAEGIGLNDILTKVPVIEGIEGWVLRFENGLRVKIKTEEYAHLHRLYWNFSPNRVYEAMLLGNAKWREYLVALPEELRGEAERIGNIIDDWAESELSRLQGAFDSLDKSGTRKDFAMQVLEKYNADKTYLFAMMDGKPIKIMLLKNFEIASLKSDYTGGSVAEE
jgi:RNA ligase